MPDDLLEEIRFLRKTLTQVSIRLEALERLAGSRPEAPATVPPPPAPSVAPVEVAPRPVAPARVAAPPPAPRENLELKIGRYWLNRIGILSLVLGTAFFLVYSFQYLGPAAKIAMGYALGAVLLVLGLRLERKTGIEWYGRGLMGGGWAVLYFTSYAMYHVPETKILNSAALDLVLLLAVAAGAIRHALRYRSPAITMLAFLLAFLTTGISEVNYFTFISSVILIGSLVIIAARMRWHGLLLYGMVGSYVTHLVAVQSHVVLDPQFVWLAGSPARALFWLLGSFLSLYWLGYTLGVLAFRERDESSRGTLLTATVLNGLLFTLFLLPRLKPAYPGTEHVALLLIGGLSLVFSAIAGKRGLNAVSTAHLFFGLTLATLAIPQKLTHRSTLLLWLAEIASLAWLGVLFNRWAFRLFALALGWATLMWIMPSEMFSRERIVAFGWSISSRWTVGSVAMVCYALAAVASRRLEPERYRWPVERQCFHIYAAAACIVLWVLTAITAPLPRVSLYWALEAGAVTSLGWILKDRGIRIFGALWFVGPILFVLASLGTRGLWDLPAALTVVGVLYAISLLCRASPPGSSFTIERHLGSVYIVTASALLAGVLWHDVMRNWLSLAWALEGLALMAIGFRLPDKAYRVSGLVVFSILVLEILFVDLAAFGGLSQLPISLTVVASFFAMSVLYRVAPPRLPFAAERHLTTVYLVTASALLAGVLWHDIPRNWLSLAWALEGLALVVVGFRLPDKAYRISGLGIFCILLLKVLFVDLAAAGTVYRILSFTVAGAILLLASFGYARFTAKEPQGAPAPADDPPQPPR